MSKSRLERLTELLKARTDREGSPLPGYKSNVASIRAEIAALQEQIEAAEEEETSGN